MAGAVLLGLGAAHLLYTYAVYPWLVSLLPSRRPRDGGGGANAGTRPPLVSVVIAARAGADPALITGKVRDLLRTIGRRCEVVVVLDGPDSHTAAGLAGIGDERVRVDVLPARAGKAVALNRAVEIAKGELLVFTDVRQRVGAGAVEALVAALASPDVGAVSGALAIADAGRAEGLYERYWRFERQLRTREAAWDSAVGVSGALYALKREFWRPLPRGLLLDDVWVPFQVIRAGRRVAFAPHAIATDVRAGSDAGELARKVRTLTGNYQLLAWMPSLLHPGKNRIWWQFMSHKVMRLLTPLAAACVGAGVLLLAGRWALLLGAATGVGVTLAWILRPRDANGRPGVGVLGAVRSGLVLLVALVVAALNAARGRWDVWSSSWQP